MCRGWEPYLRGRCQPQSPAACRPDRASPVSASLRSAARARSTTAPRQTVVGTEALCIIWAPRADSRSVRARTCDQPPGAAPRSSWNRPCAQDAGSAGVRVRPVSVQCERQGAPAYHSLPSTEDVKGVVDLGQLECCPTAQVFSARLLHERVAVLPRQPFGRPVARPQAPLLRRAPRRLRPKPAPFVAPGQGSRTVHASIRRRRSFAGEGARPHSRPPHVDLPCPGFSSVRPGSAAGR